MRSAQTVAEVQVTPETMTLGVGQKQTLFATAFDPRGNLIQAAKFTFWSSDTLIAQVRKDGTVVGVKPGLAKIEARSQGRRASMAILITGSALEQRHSGRHAPRQRRCLPWIPPHSACFPARLVRIIARGSERRRYPGGARHRDWKVAQAGDCPGRHRRAWLPAWRSGERRCRPPRADSWPRLPVDVSQADFVLTQQGDAGRGRGRHAPRAGTQPGESGNPGHAAMALDRLGGCIGHAQQGSFGPAPPDRQRSSPPDSARNGRRRCWSIGCPMHWSSRRLKAVPIQVPLRSTRQFTAVAEAAIRPQSRRRG